MQKRFVALREDRPGLAWLSRFKSGRGETGRWYLGQGRDSPATSVECTGVRFIHVANSRAYPRSRGATDTYYSLDASGEGL